MRRLVSKLFTVMSLCVYGSARTRFLTYRNVGDPFSNDYASNQYGGRFGVYINLETSEKKLFYKLRICTIVQKVFLWSIKQLAL
jgi:hypothetical protein